MKYKMYITAEEVMELWGVKLTSAYKLIRECNKELKKQGCMYISGKCPREFFMGKMGLLGRFGRL